MTVEQILAGWRNGTLNRAELVSGLAQLEVPLEELYLPEGLRADVERLRAAMGRGEAFTVEAKA